MPIGITTEIFKKSYWNYFLELEEEFLLTQKYVTFDKLNFNTFSAEYIKLIQAVLWGDRIFEKCGIRRDEGGDGGKTLEIRGKRRLSARDGGANYQQS